MSEADKLFEELGYEKKVENQYETLYTSNITLMGEQFVEEISFKKVAKIVGTREMINMQELKAINKKCEELGWFE